MVERYIELLCRYQPEGVYNFLRSNDNYRIEEAQDVSIAKVVEPVSLQSRPTYLGPNCPHNYVYGIVCEVDCKPEYFLHSYVTHSWQYICTALVSTSNAPLSQKATKL